MIEFMLGLPTWIKLIIGVNLLWTSTFWIIPEPIVIVTEFEHGAVNFGNVVIVTSSIYDIEDEYKSYVLAHEYVHFLQSAILTPFIDGPIYTLCAWYSILTIGNQWENNPFEQQAIDWGDKLTFNPRLVIRF